MLTIRRNSDKVNFNVDDIEIKIAAKLIKKEKVEEFKVQIQKALKNDPGSLDNKYVFFIDKHWESTITKISIGIENQKCYIDFGFSRSNGKSITDTEVYCFMRRTIDNNQMLDQLQYIGI